MGVLKKCIIKSFCFVVLFAFTQSCALQSEPIYDLPYSYSDDAPDMWKLGWQHGCKSGFTAYGSDYHRTLYKFTQDVERMKDTMYYKAWLDSFNYCRHYINKYLSDDSASYQSTPGVFSDSSLEIMGGDRRQNRSLTATGLFSSEKTNKGFFGDSIFNTDLQSNSWGKNVKKCDWLNRCGDDAPADWHF